MEEIQHSFRQEKKDKLIAALLAFFMGVFGVHHFYLGNKGRGIIYLIFFWTAFPAIIAGVEGILWLLMDEDEFDYKYNLGVEPRPAARRAIPNNRTPRYSSPSPRQTEEYEERISIADEIEKLHNLMVRGIISEREFAERKKRL